MQILIGLAILYAIYLGIGKLAGVLWASIGWQWVLGVFLLLGYLVVFTSWRRKQRHQTQEQARNQLVQSQRENLLSKYLGDIETVEKIMSRSVWEGQTEDELIDSLGEPIEVDQKILKTKSKEIWKYKKTGKGRFGLRVTLENNRVVGWEIKDSA